MKNINVIYYTLSGNTESFARKLTDDPLDIKDAKRTNQHFVLLTPTYKFGQVPDIVSEWLEDNHTNMVGVVSFGNRNWGSDFFGKAGDLISEMYDVELISKIELRGTSEDVIMVKERINDLRSQIYKK